MLASGFANAPVSRGLVLWVVTGALLSSLTDVRVYLGLDVVPHLWRYGQWWRLLAWQVRCPSTNGAYRTEAERLTEARARVAVELHQLDRSPLCRHHAVQSARRGAHVGQPQVCRACSQPRPVFVTACTADITCAYHTVVSHRYTAVHHPAATTALRLCPAPAVARPRQPLACGANPRRLRAARPVLCRRAIYVPVPAGARGPVGCEPCVLGCAPQPCKSGCRRRRRCASPVEPPHHSDFQGYFIPVPASTEPRSAARLVGRCHGRLGCGCSLPPRRATRRRCCVAHLSGCWWSSVAPQPRSRAAAAPEAAISHL